MPVCVAPGLRRPVFLCHSSNSVDLGKPVRSRKDSGTPLVAMAFKYLPLLLFIMKNGTSPRLTIFKKKHL